MRQAKEEGNERQDLGFHGGNIYKVILMLTGMSGKVYSRKSQ